MLMLRAVPKLAQEHSKQQNPCTFLNKPEEYVFPQQYLARFLRYSHPYTHANCHHMNETLLVQVKQLA